MSLQESQIKELLSTVIDPMLGADIVTYRVLKKIEIAGDQVTVHIDIPTHAYPIAKRRELALRIEETLQKGGVKNVVVQQEVVTAYIPAPSEKAILKGPKNIIAVAAGKGGVGKSTVATNMALALARHGAKVGILDADVFGPSIPTMLGPADKPPGTTPESKIAPAIHHGIKVISVGFFVGKDEAVVWRGPMVHRLLQQFLGDVEWGDLDYLVCDLPPGTDDVQLSLSLHGPVMSGVYLHIPEARSQAPAMLRHTLVLLSGQGIVVPVHMPEVQVSPVVHAFMSSHGPELRGVYVHMPPSA